MPARTVALVTLGCARNEVDSEELAGRLEAGGWTLVDDAGRRRRRRGQHLRVRRAGEEGLDRRAARGRRAQGRRGARTQAVVAVGCLAERYGTAARRGAARGRRGARLRLLRRHVRPPATRSWRASGPRSHVPRDRRTLLPLTPGRAPGRPPAPGPAVPGHARRTASDLPEGVAPASGPAGAAPAAGRPALGAAEDRVRLRPALRVLRHPGVPRRVLSRAARRRAGRGALAGRAGRPRGVPGQRELDVVRQGPRRPAAARDAAARAGRGRGHRAGAGLLPAAGRDAARPARRHGRHARASCRTSTCPSSTPRAPLLRRMRRFGGTRVVPRPARAGPRARARRPASGPTSSSGFPGETEDDVAELERVPDRPRGSTSSACSATPTRTAPRPRRYDGKLPDDVVAERVAAAHRPGRAAHRPAGRGAHRRAGRGARRGGRATRTAGRRGGRAAHQGPDVDGATLLRSPGSPAPRSVTSCRAASSAREGVDLRRRRRDAGARGPPPGRAGGRRRADGSRSPHRPPAQRLEHRQRPDRRCGSLLVPVFGWLLLHDGGDEHAAGGSRPAWSSPSPSVTDRFDGELARRRGLVTDVGKIADPIADKALIGCRAGRPVPARRAALVGDRRRPGPRGRHHAAAVRGDPARRHAGQPRRQGQDVAAGAGDRPVRAAAGRRWGTSRPARHGGRGGRDRRHRAPTTCCAPRACVGPASATAREESRARGPPAVRRERRP